MKNRNITFGIILSVLACFALLPAARAVCQEGCDTSNLNTFLGDDALVNNTTGTDNTAIGFNALFSNTEGSGNTATGLDALQLNTNGSFNTAIGEEALRFNTTGSFNTATGSGALIANTTGSNNTATGLDALVLNATGNFNTAIGEDALYNNNGSRNIALGYKAGTNLTTGSKNIDIGNDGVAGESRTIRIGRVGDQFATYIAGISGATVPTGVGVIVDINGNLGTTTSSARFKESIKPMDKASQAILALRPVTFRYKHDLDPEGIPQFGLVAEDVEKVNPDLAARDDQGKPYTVRYEAVNAMLLNELLKEHKKVEDLEATVASLVATVKEQAAQIQKVSAEFKVSKPVAKVALTAGDD